MTATQLVLVRREPDGSSLDGVVTVDGRWRVFTPGDHGWTRHGSLASGTTWAVHAVPPHDSRIGVVAARGRAECHALARFPLLET